MRRYQTARKAFDALTRRLAGISGAPGSVVIASGSAERTVSLAGLDPQTLLALRDEQAAGMREAAGVISHSMGRRLVGYGRAILCRMRQFAGDAEGMVPEAVCEGLASFEVGGTRSLRAHSKRAIGRYLSANAEAMRPAPEGYRHVDAADVGAWDADTDTENDSPAPRRLPDSVTRQMARLPAHQAAALERFLEDGQVSTDHLRAVAALQAACGRPAPVHFLCRAEKAAERRIAAAARDEETRRVGSRVHGMAARALSKGWAPGMAASRAGIRHQTMAAAMRKLANRQPVAADSIPHGR